MPWIFFLLALGCFALAMRTQSMGFAMLLLLAALGLMLAGALGLLAARIQSRAANAGMALNPALEKQRLAQQRGSATTAASGSDAGGVDTGSSSGPRKAPHEPADADGDGGGGGGGGGD